MTWAERKRAPDTKQSNRTNRCCNRKAQYQTLPEECSFHILVPRTALKLVNRSARHQHKRNFAHETISLQGISRMDRLMRSKTSPVEKALRCNVSLLRIHNTKIIVRPNMSL